ncbi:NADH-quinone oxidoreductase subunit J family protein [Actinomadura roseirufa]|uniref:NADH-quinone oxidoreductase subunit J family protein n=1 Tax=Actinomadura roseirufa TaxID=2094049 RepID=UPI0010417A19|nr:NADH-quinone oxidoreductase subunit J [Actinomadura roseirufa]
MNGKEIVFALLGVVTVGAGFMVVTTRQLVHAALWLVLSFGALAGGYLVLTAEFVAWVQVLIYVGAVVVLLLFGIMLTRAPIGESADLDSGNRWVAAAVAAATAAVLVTVMVMGFGDTRMPLRAGGGSADELGAGVFRTWVLPFEVLSVLLLASLVGAIVLSRTDIGAAPQRRPGRSARPGPGGGAARPRRTVRPGSGAGADAGTRPGGAARPEDGAGAETGPGGDEEGG